MTKILADLVANAPVFLQLLPWGKAYERVRTRSLWLLTRIPSVSLILRPLIFWLMLAVACLAESTSPTTKRSARTLDSRMSLWAMSFVPTMFMIASPSLPRRTRNSSRGRVKPSLYARLSGLLSIHRFKSVFMSCWDTVVVSYLPRSMDSTTLRREHWRTLLITSWWTLGTRMASPGPLSIWILRILMKSVVPSLLACTSVFRLSLLWLHSDIPWSAVHFRLQDGRGTKWNYVFELVESDTWRYCGPFQLLTRVEEVGSGSLPGSFCDPSGIKRGLRALIGLGFASKCARISHLEAYYSSWFWCILLFEGVIM